MHERPVLDTPIHVIYEDEDMLVVNKPASMVIYPHNGYRLNTVLFILAKERGHTDLRLVHRLDKGTRSGHFSLSWIGVENCVFHHQLRFLSVVRLSWTFRA